MGFISLREIIKPCEFFLCILTAIYCFVLLIINAVERANLNAIPSQQESLILSSAAEAALANIVLNPITSIEIQKSSSSASCAGELIKLYSWETVFKYCDCGDSITRKYCPRRSPCKNITKKAFPMYNWLGNKFCVKRLSPDDWDFSSSKGGSCSENFRPCSGGICVSKSIQDCPITDFIISNTNPSTSGGASYTNVSYFADTRSVFISRNKDKSILTTLVAGVPDAPCIDVKTAPKRTKQDSFPIIEIEPNGCNFNKDYGVDSSIYNNVDVSEEWSFYEDNMDLTYFLSLPGYRTFVGDEKITLYARNKIEFRKDKGSCATYDFNSLRYVSADVNIFENLRMGVNITALIVCPIVMVFMMLFLIVELCCSDRDYKGIFFSTTFVYVIFAFLMTLALIILQGIANNYVNAVDDSTVLLKELGESQCFVLDVYNRIFEEFKSVTLQSFDIGRAYNAAGLGLSITYFILSFFYMVLKIIFVAA